MTDFLFFHLASIGLLFDMVGVTILFFVIVTIGEQVILLDEEENKIRAKGKKRKENILRVGYTLIFLGFVLQITSNEMNNNSIKNKIDLSKERTINVTTVESNSNQRDYSYDSVAVLIGILKIESYFGQPNYGESPSTDVREDTYILTLDASINVIQKSEKENNEGSDVTKFNNYKIQLAPMNEINLHSFINKKIKITGTFYGAITGHHHTPVLLAVTRAEKQ